MKQIVLITTTVENKADAERMTELLLQGKKIACAQIAGPLTSLYRWQGKVTSATEFSLSLKTVPGAADEVRDILNREHPYELPEIIVQHVDDTSTEYARWVYEEVGQ